jgi:hypothetical protein
MSMLNQLQITNPDADAIFKREMRESEEGPETPPEGPNELFRMWLTTGSFPWESDGAPYWSVFRATPGWARSANRTKAGDNHLRSRRGRASADNRA